MLQLIKKAVRKFIKLDDTFSSYAGLAGQYLRVKADESGLEAVALVISTKEVDYMEYATNVAAQAAYASNDPGTLDVTASQLTSTNDLGISWGGKDAEGQGFKVSSGIEPITKISLILDKNAGATGTITVYIYSDDGTGKPSASLATFSSLDVATGLTTSPAGYNFTGTFLPTANTQYHIVWIWTGGSGTIRGWGIYSNPYADGAFSDRVYGGSWSGYGYDLYFKIYQQVPHVQCYSESTIKAQGSYSLKGAAIITESSGKTLTRTVSPTIDLTGMTKITFSIYASRTGANIKIGLHDSGGTTTEKTYTVVAANTWETVTWDISGVADGNKDAIDQIIVTIVDATAANTFYLDWLLASHIV